MANHHNIDCLVDTNPMAEKIQTVGNKVEHTTMAVVAMKTACLLYTSDAAELAQKKSRTEALLTQLYMQKRRLLEIKNSMETDYRRISARYGRIISSINKQLEQRIID